MLYLLVHKDEVQQRVLLPSLHFPDGRNCSCQTSPFHVKDIGTKEEFRIAGLIPLLKIFLIYCIVDTFFI